MVKTHGLTHIAVSVHDPQRSAAFYAAVFGCVVVYDQPDFVQLRVIKCRKLP